MKSKGLCQGWGDDQLSSRKPDESVSVCVYAVFCVLSVCMCPSMSLSSELTRGSLIRLKQSDDGRVALGTFNELLQRQSACGDQKKPH